MAEVWLRTNRRAILMIMVPVALVGLAGVIMATGAFDMIESVWLRSAGWLLVAVAAVVTATLGFELRQPRLAYEAGHLLVNMKKDLPFRVPIEVIEAFLLGQAPAFLRGGEPDAKQTATVVIQLAERASEWSRMEVEPALGSWCDGYITIRGTWCEPLTVDLVRTLNSRLAELTREPSP